jgi:hypothetical protein
MEPLRPVHGCQPAGGGGAPVRKFATRTAVSFSTRASWLTSAVPVGTAPYRTWLLSGFGVVGPRVTIGAMGG